MPWWGEVLVGLTLAISVFGTIIPVLPGALLAAAAIGIWAFVEGGAAWWVAAVCAVLLVVGQVLKVLMPARTIRGAQVPWRVIAVGSVAGIVGFFVVPIIGLPLGFVLGIWVATVIQMQGLTDSWQRTWTTLKAVGISTLIEAASVYLAALIWTAGAVAIGVT